MQPQYLRTTKILCLQF